MFRPRLLEIKYPMRLRWNFISRGLDLVQHYRNVFIRPLSAHETKKFTTFQCDTVYMELRWSFHHGHNTKARITIECENVVC